MNICIGGLSSLNMLKLSLNSLSSSIPDSIGYLVSLTLLEIFDNALTGPLPTSIGQF